MRNHYPLLLAPPLAVALLVLIYGTSVTWVPMIAWFAGIDLSNPIFEDLHRRTRHMSNSILIVAAVLYGMARTRGFHPRTHLHYREWLKLTPWTPDRPLPLWPLRWVWQDALPVGALVGLSIVRGGQDAAYVFVAFAAAYLLFTAIHLALGGALITATVLAAGLPILLFREVEPWLAAMIAAALYPIAFFGIAKMLRNFPWEMPDLRQPHTPLKLKLQNTLIGWPFSKLSPSSPPLASRSTLIVLSVLVAWWTFAVLRRFWEPNDFATDQRHAIGMVAAVGLAVSVVRTMRYIVGYASPISIFGRLATGRLIIPGYDKVWVAPICAMVLSGALPQLLTTAGFSLAGAVGLSVAPVLLAGILIGPTLSAWQLTGHHFIVRASRMQNGDRAAVAVGG